MGSEGSWHNLGPVSAVIWNLKTSSSGTHGLSSPFYALFSGREGRDTFFRSYLLKYFMLSGVGWETHKMSLQTLSLPAGFSCNVMGWATQRQIGW